MPPIPELLDRHFHFFEPALRQLISGQATLKHAKAGDTIMQTGQYFKSTVLIASGRVKVYREGEDGGEFFMYYLEPGNACALSMICATRQETSEIMARAVEDTSLILLPGSLMDDLMRTYKTWYYFVLETYRTRFEELLGVIDGVTFRGLDERLVFYLDNQVKKLGTVNLPLTHQEIATDLNSSREVISRLLKKMEQRCEVRLHRTTIEWLRP